MSLSVVMVVHNRLALTRACLESLRGATEEFELCVVDNASTDGTGAFLERWGRRWSLRYARNEGNAGLIRALNQGAALATGRILCFLHNDTEMRDVRALGRLRAAVESGSHVGLAGVYGARRVRRDGRFAGRTIVHCLDGSTLGREVIEVAVVDGVCLTISRVVLDRVGGFDEGYGFFHGYDRDLSLAVREAGYRCVVANAPFVHHGGGTRTSAAAPMAEAADLAQRRAALTRFAAKWRHRLPCDVRSWRERLADRVRRGVPDRPST